jgi:hypothetical protein
MTIEKEAEQGHLYHMSLEFAMTYFSVDLAQL